MSLFHVYTLILATVLQLTLISARFKARPVPLVELIEPPFGEMQMMAHRFVTHVESGKFNIFKSYSLQSRFCSTLVLIRQMVQTKNNL